MAVQMMFPTRPLQSQIRLLRTFTSSSWIAVMLLAAWFIPVPLTAQELAANAPRAQVTVNGLWDYVLNQSQDHIPTSGWKTRRIPEPPLNDGTASVWYRKTINIPSEWVRPGRSFFLELEKAGHYAAVYWNGTLIADHFGQFSPFEVEVTPAVLAGQDNTIYVYVHKADTKYVRRGAVVDQSSCPMNNPDCMGNSYRPFAPNAIQRNWVGMVGDITFSWRPSENISDVAIVSSVRNWTLAADLQVAGAGFGRTSAQATVLDGSKEVLSLPNQPVVNGAVKLQASWTTPTLWGPPSYGQPTLYTLRTDLLQDGKLVDTVYTRFGFREVWVNGKDVLLNGKKLWMSGDYAYAPARYSNDRRPEAFLFHIMESSGHNGLHSHWDEGGRPWLELADEMGLLVLGAFYCNGPLPEALVDDATAWTDWMAATAQEWVRARRNHPSIILWRPIDVVPKGVVNSNVYPPVAAAVRSVDPSGRPIVDGSDIDPWHQSSQDPRNPRVCDDGSALAAKLAGETKPLLVKEIYGNFSLPCTKDFFNTIYQIAYTGGAVGLIVQELDVFQYHPFTPTWFSSSGRGNRPTTSNSLPNWITRLWTPTNWTQQFADLYRTYLQTTLPRSSPTAGDYHASGIPAATQAAFLVPQQRYGNPVGVLTADDGSGTAWFVVPQPGPYTLDYTAGTGEVEVNVNVHAPLPFVQWSAR